MNRIRYVILCFITILLISAETDKYRLVWNDDPATTMTIAWNQVNGSNYHVFCGMDANLTDGVNYLPDREISYRDMENKFVRLKNLQPNTRYYFQIRDNNSQSKTMWFLTAPNQPMPFTFIAGGDSRTNEEPRQNGNKLIAKIRPLFIAHGGDYLNRGTSEEWHMWLDEWQMTCSEDGRMYPIIPAHGNHENDDRYMMYNLFDIPNKDAYYAMNIAGNLLRLYTLNTELEPGVGYGEFEGQDAQKWREQNVWFKKDLENFSGQATWRIVNYHRPLRPHTSAKSEGLGRIAAWAELFFKHNIHIAVECDTHMVKYTYPVRPSNEKGSYESFIRDDKNGTVFIGEGSWGAPTRPTDDDKPWTLASDSFWQYKLIHMAPEKIAIRTVKFGKLEELKKGIHYDSSSVTSLKQEEQDINPLAIPKGLDLWKPLHGEALHLPFELNHIEHKNYIPTKSSWKYNSSVDETAVNWYHSDFNDESWATIVSGNKIPESDIVYLRKNFVVEDDLYHILRLTINAYFNDAAIVYINGREILRYNLSKDETPVPLLKINNEKFIEFPIPSHTIYKGSNCIAIVLYRKDPGAQSSFDIDLTAIVSLREIAPPTAPTNLKVQVLSSKDVKVEWAQVSEAEVYVVKKDSNNEEILASKETLSVYYQLERRKEGENWKVLSNRLQVTSYEDVVDSESTYTYRVRAIHAYGVSQNNDIVVSTPKTPTNIILQENFSNNLGTFSRVSLCSNAEWSSEFKEERFSAVISGYGADENSDDWLISPLLDFTNKEQCQLFFDAYAKYDGGSLTVKVSQEYNGKPDECSWEKLEVTLPEQNSRTWTSCHADLAKYANKKIHLAFHYTSGTKGGEAASWYITNIEIVDGERQTVTTKTVLQQEEKFTEQQPNIRVATFNVSLYRNKQGELVNDLAKGVHPQIKNLAEIIQRVRPDIILLNEFDYVADGSAVELFRKNYLHVSQNNAEKIDYPYYYVAPSNTGIDSGYDLNNDGLFGTPDDAFGYGAYPGQYAMAILSKYPIKKEQARTFQKFLWKDMPGALLPIDPATQKGWYSEEELKVFRLSSKNHVDLPIDVNGRTIHILASHPTPPVFDGEEDRNGKRNHDEIRFWRDYINAEASSYIYDDNGHKGGIAENAAFVIVGDLNACAVEKDAIKDGIKSLLSDPKVYGNFEPKSKGGQENDPRNKRGLFHTAAWKIRVDYVLPSQKGLKIKDGGVFWPGGTSKYYRLVSSAESCSDHRLVFLDLEIVP